MRAVLFVLLAFTSVLSAQTITNPTTNPIVAYAYVGENTTPGNISAFAIRLDGMISRVSGSPFRGPAQNLVVSSGYVIGTDRLNITTYTRLATGALLLSSVVNGVAHNDTPNGSAVGGMTLDRTGSSLYASEINFRGTDNAAYESRRSSFRKTISLRMDRAATSLAGTFLLSIVMPVDS